MTEDREQIVLHLRSHVSWIMRCDIVKAAKVSRPLHTWCIKPGLILILELTVHTPFMTLLRAEV